MKNGMTEWDEWETITIYLRPDTQNCFFCYIMSMINLNYNFERPLTYAILKLVNQNNIL